MESLNLPYKIFLSSAICETIDSFSSSSFSNSLLASSFIFSNLSSTSSLGMCAKTSPIWNLTISSSDSMSSFPASSKLSFDSLAALISSSSSWNLLLSLPNLLIFCWSSHVTCVSDPSPCCIFFDDSGNSLLTMELETTADSSHKKLSPATTDNNELGFGPWAGLNPDLLISIFVRILPIDAMVRAVPLVCTAWRNALNRPDCWAHIDLEQWCHRHEVDTAMVDFAVRNVVQRSSGTLTTLSVFKLGNSGFFSACSSSFLRVLEMRGSDVTDQMVEKHAEALSKLTTLDISDCLKITSKGIRVLGKYCMSLVELRRNLPPPYFDDYTEVDELEAMAIADSMHSIEHLELACGRFSNQGVSAILSNCGTLRVLDIRGCCNLGDVDIRKKFDSILRGRVTLKTSAAWFVGDEDVDPSDDEGDSEDDEADSEGEDGYDSSAGLVDVDTSDDSDDGYD